MPEFSTPPLLQRYLCLLLLGLMAASGCGHRPSVPPKHEFRAVWIASFHNIDWPSAKGLTTDAQQAEFRQILDQQRQNNMNAVIVQVRPCGDALYESPFEPWSEYLSGKQGQAPAPYYDPLSFMIEEAHQRTMEFHAWLNPFRAVSHTRFSDLISDHLSLQQPDWFFQYGNSLYFNPGIPEVRTYIASLVSDILKRYDVDGIHFDDYFYPYPQDGKPIPDQAAFEAYRDTFTDLATWRRHNIDLFVQQVSDSIRRYKPHVRLGISPSAVWRNKSKDPRGSDTQAPMTTFDLLHADVRKWLEAGWVDYVAPQCYFAMNFSQAPYPKLLDWWSENVFGRHLYIGQAVYKSKEGKYASWRKPEQIPDQVRLNRKYPGVRGSIYFSASSFDNNPRRIAEKLRYDLYRKPALIPAMPWKDSIPPQAPRFVYATYDPSHIQLQWQPPAKAMDGEAATYYVVYRFDEEEIIDRNDPVFIRSIQRSTQFTDQQVQAGKSYTYLITAVDRNHNESLAAERLEVEVPAPLAKAESSAAEADELSNK
jgi:uncharacterized lipoprotein YddW (UPF0748 family)